MEETVQLVVEDTQAGTRLDRFVASMVVDLSRTFAQQLIEDGHIALNGRDAHASDMLRLGDTVTVRRPIAKPSELVAENIPLAIVYEDADVVVIDKPAGMVVHPAPGHATGTLVNALLARYPEIQIGSDLRPGIVHRLDRDTSGLIVIARNHIAMHNLQEQQQARTMSKRYLAVVEGRFKEPKGIIDAPIGRQTNDRKRMAVIASGRMARTHWRVLEELGDYTLIEARLETGRTHQIRVHFAHKSRPVLGDSVYGLRKPKSTFGLTRQFLHAYTLGFRLPSTGVWGEWTSPLPEELQQVLEKLRRQAAASSISSERWTMDTTQDSGENQ